MLRYSQTTGRFARNADLDPSPTAAVPRPSCAQDMVKAHPSKLAGPSRVSQLEGISPFYRKPCGYLLLGCKYLLNSPEALLPSSTQVYGKPEGRPQVQESKVVLYIVRKKGLVPTYISRKTKQKGQR